MLPSHERIALEIAHVVVRRLRIEFEKKPANVGVEKPFLNVVRIFLVIGVLVMPAMFARPHQNGIFEGAGAEKKDEQTHRPARFVGFVCKKPVVTGGDAESGESGQNEEHSALKPVEIEEPKINRQTDNGEECRSNEERTGHPVDPIPGGGKHGQMSIFTSKTSSARARRLFSSSYGLAGNADRSAVDDSTSCDPRPLP